MAWEVQINIEAPVERVFATASSWHIFPELKSLAAVSDYHVISSEDRTEYFWSRVKDLPFKTSWCYGKTMSRKPDLLVTIFTYRLFRSRSLSRRESLEAEMNRNWESFYLQTVRLARMGNHRTRLFAWESGTGSPDPDQLKSALAYYNALKTVAEGELVRLGINAIAEEVEPGDTEAWWSPENEPYEKDSDVIDAEIEDDAQPAIDDSYDPYAILGISPQADLNEIKAAYRSMAMQWHPDRAEKRGQARKEYAHNQFIEVTAAYHSILKLRNF
jgi:hypothetical protein